MKVNLINEMTLTTSGGYLVKYDAEEEVDLKRDTDDDLLIVDNDDNMVKVDDEEIFEAVLKNSRFGKKREGIARVPLKKVLEEVDAEVVADFMAATNQIPDESAEEGAKEHFEDEDWSYEDLMVDVPVTIADDTPLEDKIDVLMNEETFEDIAPDSLKDMEALSIELVDDAPEFIKNQDDNPKADDISEVEANDPDIPEIGNEPEAEGEEFYEAVVNVKRMKRESALRFGKRLVRKESTSRKRMKRETNLNITPEGYVDIDTGMAGDFSINDQYIEPELGAAGVNAPTKQDPSMEPVLPEEPINNPEDGSEDEALNDLLGTKQESCGSKKSVHRKSMKRK